MSGPDPDRPQAAAAVGDDVAAAAAPLLVGIGASAGGIRALREFFRDVPGDANIVFVVVLHLSPDYDSNLAEVLQPFVRMPVRKVEGRVALEPNHVYVIPQNRSLAVEDGHLAVAEFGSDRARRAAIDYFFRTIADVHPDGVGVLLSGSGSDGAIGMRAIKEAGGVILAQLPEEAEYGEMPRSIVATGLVDFVLPARQLGAKVVALRTMPAPHALAVPDGQLAEILHQLKLRTGHDASGYKTSTVLRRIARRMRVAQLEELTDYAELLRRSEAEPHALLKDLLIGVTRFFRDPATFKVLARDIIPDILSRTPPGESVRVWVPACATGEEAYSLAMLFHEQAATWPLEPSVQIFASDPDEDAIARARDGVYPAAIAADIDEVRLERFFRRDGAFFRVRKELRETILFAAHNLLRDPPFSRVDLISCRNLLIYLQRDLQDRVFDVFHYALRDDGILVLGSSENIESGSLQFRTLDRTHRIYQRKPLARPASERFPELPLSPAPRRRHDHARLPPGSSLYGPDAAELHRNVLEQRAPPSVLVDENGTILHVSESAARYLQFPSGTPTANLLKAARAELRVELRAAVFQALQKRRPCLAQPVTLQLDGQLRLVQIHAAPADGPAAQLAALVVFLESDDPESAGTGGAGGMPGSLRRQVDADEELDVLRDRLQHTVEEADIRDEELKASNEELQSINEEYKSTLEELETSREELQSMNEELKTVNDELKLKVEDLARSNDDLRNLMNVTDIATLFLDRQLRIKRFTPALRRIFNIMPIDEGRPLTDLTHRLDYPAFRDDCRRVLETLQPLERETDAAEGQAVLVRITPYRTDDDRIAGVVATFTDITSIRRALDDLRSSEQRYRLLIEGVHEYAIFMMDAGGLVTMWNPGAQRIFGHAEADILGSPAAIVFTPEDRAARLPELEMATARTGGQAVAERWHLRSDGTRFWASGTLTALRGAGGELRGFAKMLRDNTTRRAQEEALRRSEAQLRGLAETLESRVASRTSQLAVARDGLRQLASDTVLAEQRVRRDIAHRLHDELQQHVYGVQMRVAALRRQTDEAPNGVLHGALADVERWLGEAVLLARRIAADLSPPVLHGDSLNEALRWLSEHMRELHGLQVAIHGEDALVESEDLRVLLFHTVRELLFNVVKHGTSKEAILEVRRENDRVLLEVSDHGPGFDPQQVLSTPDHDGFGLGNVLERLRLFGGDMFIDSAPGRGSKITIVAPGAEATENS